jgi:sucrose-6-phosphatase
MVGLQGLGRSPDHQNCSTTFVGGFIISLSAGGQIETLMLRGCSIRVTLRGSIFYPLKIMRWLLVTDLDNTLVGDNQSLAALNTILQAHRQNLFLVYSTGRSLISYQHLCTEADLLPPDALVTSVGTEIYEHNSDRPSPEWSAQLQENWDRDLVAAIAQDFSVLVPQADEAQGPFKASYHVASEEAERILPELEARLQDKALSAQIIYSSGHDLDILPVAADKGNAMTFVRQQLGVPLDQSVACGDSGNDRALFRDSQQQGIIVGNALSELLDWHRQQPSPFRYLAKAHCAAGILEGLQYFQFI